VTLLALETSTPQGTLAVVSFEQDQCRVLAEQSWDKKSTHSDVVTLSVEAALKKSQKKMADLSHLAVDIGPGSFTGLRVGINLIKTLSFSLAKPVFTVSSLELLAYQHLKDGDLGLIGIRAIQNFYYFAIFKRKNLILETALAPTSGSLEEIDAHSKNCTKILVEGMGQTPPLQPTATDLAHMAAKTGSHYGFHSWQSLKPLYVRGSEAEEKLKKASKL
jgi:tRNA threonylcarbamoyladenosine biosynthesis protein TsaB